MERWVALGRLLLGRNGIYGAWDLDLLQRWLPEEIVVEDVGVADAPMRIRHSLGRVPRGMVVMNQVVPSGTAPVAWYRVEGDEAWTAVEVVVRWTVGNARVVVRVW